MSKRRRKKDDSKTTGTITTFLISEEERERRIVEEKETTISTEDLESIVNTIFSLIKAKSRVSKAELMTYCKSRNIKPQHMYKAIEALINRKLINRRIINDELHYEIANSSHR
ncbi:MAG: hypothetical protein B6V02_03515 [Thermoprotei archaeon ex4572_64]|nr:MAG: hypothetical protein B6V02_03515 [Thermoprotei archaeon ex4572_64]